MKKIFFIVAFFIMFSATASANNYIDNVFNWKRIKVFEYDLLWQNYNLKVWVNNDYEATDLRELMEKNNWVSAINWVFFCPADYRECGGKNFTKNERFVEWLQYSQNNDTWDRVVFAWDKQTKPFLYQTGKINKNSEKNIYYWLANFPLLLQNWENKLAYYEEKWLIDSWMKKKWTRNFICSNKEKTRIYTGLIFDISVPEVPDFLKEFGCWDALNLDAGKTTSMIYNGRQIAWPGRDLLDAVIIERKWLDTAKIRELSNWVMEKILANMSDKSLWEQIEILSDMSKKLSEYKNVVYDKHSFYFYNSEWEKTGYKIVMNDLNNLSNMYLVNHISRSINTKLAELKKEKELQDNAYDLLF